VSNFKFRSLLSNFVAISVAISVAVLLGSALFAPAAIAASDDAKSPIINSDPNMLDELNPFDPKTEAILEEFDSEYQRRADKTPWLESLQPQFRATSCFRSSCKVYAFVRRSDQRMYLYVDGNPYGEWPVSTGAPGHDTPNFDRHPNGRIYDQYTSSKFPGGNYQGLGNMPYAVFIEGGFAIHGTAKSNWSKLGRKASHGCVRVHPDNGFTFNRLVRKYGIADTWIQVSE
jgi:lipoprotein-anchoring transpeptidase ErfK/SrfK